MTQTDHIFTNMQIPVGSFTSRALIIYMTDQLPVLCVLLHLKTEYSTQYVLKINFIQKSIFKFNDNLKKMNLTYLHQVVDFDQTFSIFYDSFCEVFNACFPEKKQKIEYKTRYQWMSASLSKCIDKKNRLFILSKSKPTLENCTVYKRYHNRQLF